MDRKTLSVTQLNEYIRARLEADPLLTEVAVRGEISNYKLYPSGHHYFSLKDEGGALKCVMFKGNAMRLRFRPENGMKVIAFGKVSVYPRDGAYQLYCTALVVDGIGDLHAAFEQLKAKLAEKGMFDPAHKKPIPQYPGVIGIVTSGAGAAVHDMLRILNKRYPLTKVRLFPVRVQGVEAPAEIAGAIAYANHFRLADLLIVGRGGGSMEDLWAFNDELVARAIYDSGIPVISAVGHEPDVTIADYVADLRAATPSNGAELAVPDAEALTQNLDSMMSAMSSALMKQLHSAKQRYKIFASASALQNPQACLEPRKKTLELYTNRLTAAQNRLLAGLSQRFVAQTAKLDAMSPLKVLSRGYAMVQKENGSVISKASQSVPGEIVSVRVSDGCFTARVETIEEEKNERTESDI